MLSKHEPVTGSSVPSQWGLVGETPFIDLQRSGEGLVSVKHEGLNPGGSYFDRVAKVQLSRLSSPEQGIVLTGTTSHTVSALTLANAASIPAVVVTRPDDSKRLVGLIRQLGGDVRRTKSSQAAEVVIAELVASGSTQLTRHDAAAHEKAMASVALESISAFGGQKIQHWVMVQYSSQMGQVERGLRRALGYDLTVHLVEDDHEQERTLSENAATRRVQVGHREGMLIGPAGAEVVDRAVAVACARGERVCAVLPDGGHRYLGWW